MIYKKEKKGDVIIYYVDKDYDDLKMSNKMGTKIKRNDIKTIINHDADVFTKEGNLLVRFRKNKLNKQNVSDFYNNVITFAKNVTTSRGTSSGSKLKMFGKNPKIMTNIIGYFDKFSPAQKNVFNKNGIKIPKITVRETRFLVEHPDKFKKAIPLIEEIDKYYKQYVPKNYERQKNKAKQTPYHIANTAFTTVTTNINYQTAIHTDKGDDDEGFGNLTVIEQGKYKGGETCFPQYGIGIDIRMYDVIYMDVHQPHGNLPLEVENPDAMRLSIVCYLRKNIWEQTKGKTKKFMIKHNKFLKNNKTIKKFN